MHILVIEDDHEAARFMVRGLRDSGHVVDHAADGTAGLGMAKAGHYDALVVDRMLPGLDGLSIMAGNPPHSLFPHSSSQWAERHLGPS